MLRFRGISCLCFNEREHINETRETISLSCNYDNSVFEEKYPFEFIVQENGKNTGFRYLRITAKRAEEIMQEYDVDKIVIICWEEDNDSISDSTPFFPSFSPIRDKVLISTLKSFFLRYFSESEYDLYLEKVCSAVKEANYIVGFQTIKQLSPQNVSDYKINTIDQLSALDYRSMLFTPKKVNTTVVPTLPDYDKTILIDNYLNRKIYRSLAGEKDFAICFFTSEYLYQTCGDQRNFDYTAIVAGYLKSVEQLVSTLLISLMNDRQKNQTLIRRRYSKNYPDEIKRETVVINRNNYLPLCTANEDYFDTTLNAMCDCIFYSSASWRVSTTGKNAMRKYLRLFSQDCRNDHFHKHNITDWKEVERIRSNTILCLFCLLGGNIYCEASDEGNKALGIVDDSFDRLYRTLFRISPAQKRFILTFPNGEVIKAIRLQHQEEEQYNDHGNTLSSMKFVRVDSFDISDYHAIEQDHTSQDEIIITRYNMPKSIEYVSYKGKTFLKW